MVRRLGVSDGLVALIFAAAVFGVYVASPIIESADSKLVVYEADSLMRQGNVDLSEYGTVVHGYPCTREYGGITSVYPYGTALFTVPFLAAARAGGALVGSDPTESLRRHLPRTLEKGLASGIAALAALMILLLTLEVVGRIGPALVAGVVFAFATPLWSTASRGLWQHGPAVLLGATALLALLRGRRIGDWRWFAGAGFALGAAFVIRPSWAAPAALTALVLLLSDRRAFAAFTAAASAVVVPSVALNLHLYGTVIVPIYLPGRGPVQGGISDTLAEGLAGTMVSPGRGLFVFTPVLLLAFTGLWLRRRSLGGMDAIAIGSILALWISTSNTITWEGGASYGPRYMTDTLPFFAYLMAPVFGVVVRPVRLWTAGAAAIAAAFVLTAGWSTFVHARGAISWATAAWNFKPTVAFEADDRSRLWQWSDFQFFRRGAGSFEAQHPDQFAPDIPLERVCRS
jgi:hypothetical protein